MRFLARATIFGFRLAPLLLAVYWILLFTGTHLPGSSLKTVQMSDKVLHFSAFAGLAFLLAWSLPKRIGARTPSLLVAAIITLTYAAIDEWTQGFVPNRSPELADFCADALGMLAGFACYLVLRRILYGILNARPAREADASPVSSAA